MKSYFLIVFILILFIALCKGQVIKIESTITLDCNNESLRDVIQKISEQSNIRFTFNDNLVDNKTVSCHFNRQCFDEAIQSIFQQAGLHYEFITPEMIVLFKEKDAKQTVVGLIIDAYNVQSLASASIVVSGTSKGTYSDKNGFFSISDVPQNSNIEVNHIGYKTYYISSDSIAHKKIAIIRMQQEPVKLDLIKIVAPTVENTNIQMKNNNISYSPQELRYLPSPGQSSIVHNIQLIPGVQAVADRINGIYIQGGIPDHNLVLYDDIPIYYNENVWGMVSTINADAIKKVTIHKSAYPVQYGGYLSGVIDMKGQIYDDNKVRMGTGLDCFGIRGYLFLPLNKRIKSSITFRNSLNIYQNLYTNNKSTFYRNSYGVPVEFTNYKINGEYSSLMGKLTYSVSNHDQLSCSYFLIKDKVIVDYDSSITYAPIYLYVKDEEIYRNHGIGLKWKHLFSGYILEISSNYSEFNTSFNPDRFPGFDKDISSLEDWHYKLLFKSTGKKYNYITGLDASYKTYNYDIQSNTLEQELLKFNTTEKSWISSFFLDNIIKPSAVIEFSPGFRFSHYYTRQKRFSNYSFPDRWQDVYYQKNMDEFFIEPRISLEVHVSRNISIHAKWRKFHQYLQYIRNVHSSFLLPYTSEGYLTFANNSEKPAYADHISISTNWNWRQHYFEITVYKKLYKNLGYMYDTKNYLLYYKNDKKMQSQGIEFSAHKKFRHTSWWLSYHLGKIENIFPDQNQGITFPRDNDRTHQFKLINHFNFKNFLISSNIIFASGSPFTKLDSLPLPDQQNDPYYYRYTYSRLPDFIRLDLSISKKFINFIKLDWEIGLTVINVLDRKNILKKYFSIEYYQYDFLNNRRTYYLTDKKDLYDLSLTPLFFINIDFNKKQY